MISFTAGATRNVSSHTCRLQSGARGKLNDRIYGYGFSTVYLFVRFAG